MTRRRLKVTEDVQSVDAYIATYPEEIRSKLKEIRSAIRGVAPGAIETTSYFKLPGYSYPGYDYNGMFVWFSVKESNIRLHLRPPVIEHHAKELAVYSKTKSILSFPADEKVPLQLVKKLVRASLDVMKNSPKGTNR